MSIDAAHTINAVAAQIWIVEWRTTEIPIAPAMPVTDQAGKLRDSAGLFMPV